MNRTVIPILLILLVSIIGCDTDAKTEERMDNADIDLTGLPESIQSYVNGINNSNLDIALSSFATNSSLTYPGGTIVGRDNIRSFLQQNVIGGSVEYIGVVEQSATSIKILVHWRPGRSNGWREHFTFSLSNANITSLLFEYA